jgi:hypothetical protein
MGLGELPALRGYQARFEDAGYGLQAVLDDQPVQYMGREREGVHRTADQLSDQSGSQGFLSCPEVVCAYGFGFSPGAPLPISAGLGSIGRESMGYRFTDGVVCPTTYEFLDFYKILRFHTTTKMCCLRKRGRFCG